MLKMSLAKKTKILHPMRANERGGEAPAPLVIGARSAPLGRAKRARIPHLLKKEAQNI